MDRQSAREQAQNQAAAPPRHRVRVHEERRQEGQPGGPLRPQVRHHEDQGPVQGVHQVAEDQRRVAPLHQDPRPGPGQAVRGGRRGWWRRADVQTVLRRVPPAAHVRPAGERH